MRITGELRETRRLSLPARPSLPLFAFAPPIPPGRPVYPRPHRMSSGKNRPLSTIAVATSSSTLLPVLPMPLMAAAALGFLSSASSESRFALALNAAIALLLSEDDPPDAVMPAATAGGVNQVALKQVPFMRGGGYWLAGRVGVNFEDTLIMQHLAALSSY